MADPKVAVILLNWNNKGDTLECIESLQHVTYPNFEVLVVDNGSTDDSVSSIRAAYPEVTLIENKANLGFTGGNNVGIRLALANGADYVLLLNNDTVVDPGFLDKLVRVMESDPSIGIAGPKMYYYSEPRRIWCAGGKVNHWRGEAWNDGNDEIDVGNFDKLTDVDFMNGCALIVTRKVLEAIGLLHEPMFCYFEENDFCARAKKHGYRIVYVPDSKIWHKIGRTAVKLKDFQLFYFTRNRLIYMKRNADPVHLAVFLPYYFVKYVLIKLAIAVVKLNFGQAKLILKAVYEGATL